MCCRAPGGRWRWTSRACSPPQLAYVTCSALQIDTMAAVIAPRLGWLQAVLTSGTLCRPRAAARRPCIVCSASSSRARASSSAAGSKPPAAAAAAAAGQEPATAAGSGPLPQPRRRELVDKLTETARSIAWNDPAGSRAPEATRAQIEALEARLVRPGNEKGMHHPLMRLVRLPAAAPAAAPAAGAGVSSHPPSSPRLLLACLQGYSFRNRYLLRLALVHSSAAPTT